MATNLAALHSHHEPALSSVAQAERVLHTPPSHTLEEQVRVVRVPAGEVPPNHVSRVRYLERQGFYGILGVYHYTTNPHGGRTYFEATRIELVRGLVEDKKYHFLFD